MQKLNKLTLNKSILLILGFSFIFQACPPLPIGLPFNGYIKLYDDTNLDGGTAYISLNNHIIKKSASPYFKIQINPKKSNSINIELKSMSKYLDFETTITIPTNQLSDTFNLMPVPKDYNVILETQNKINSYINYAESSLKELEDKAKTIDDPKFKAEVEKYIEQKRILIKSYNERLEMLISDLKPFEPNFENGNFKARDISRLADINIGFIDLKKETSQTFNEIFAYDIKADELVLTGKLNWKPTEYLLSDSQKKEIDNLIKQIKTKKTQWNKKGEIKNVLTAFIYIECSADMNTTISRDSFYKEAKKYLEREQVTIDELKAVKSDDNNKQLALLRGYSVFKYIIENHDCKTCIRQFTLLNHGSALNKANPTEINKEKFRYAKIEYRIKQ